MGRKRELLDRLNDGELAELAKRFGVEVGPDLMQSVLGEAPDRERYVQVLVSSDALDEYDVRNFLLERSGKRPKRVKPPRSRTKDLLRALKAWSPGGAGADVGRLAAHIETELGVKPREGAGGASYDVDLDVDGHGIVLLVDPTPEAVRALDGRINECMEVYCNLVIVIVDPSGSTEAAQRPYISRWRTWGARVVTVRGGEANERTKLAKVRRAPRNA